MYPLVVQAFGEACIYSGSDGRGFVSDTRTIWPLKPPSSYVKPLYGPLKLIQELALNIEDLLSDFRSKQEYSYAVA